MKVRGAKTIHRWGTRLRGRWIGGGVILGYHRIAEDPQDPWGMTITPELFREQMARLRRDCRPLGLDALVSPEQPDHLAAREVPVAVTFDDGYADVMSEALPILEEFEIPATLFVVSEALGQPFWWDQLRWLENRASSLPPTLELSAPAGPISWDRGSGVPALITRLFLGLRRESIAVRGALLDQVWTWSGGPPPSEMEASSPLPMVLTEEQVREMDTHPLVEIGSHSATHPALPALSPDVARAEVRGSRKTLSDILSRPIRSFSYPFGFEDRAIRRQVQEAGYEWACSSRAGLVSARNDPFLLPRLWAPEAGGQEFRQWLRGWAGR